MMQMCAEFNSAPTSTREYEIRGKKYIVTSHYAGEKDIGQTIFTLATDYFSDNAMRMVSCPICFRRYAATKWKNRLSAAR